MTLIRNTTQLKAVIGRAVTNTVDFDKTFAPHVKSAESQVLQKAIGAEIIASLDDKLTANTLNTDETKLLEYCRGVVAWSAYRRWLNFAIGADGDNGLSEQAAEKTVPVRQWGWQKRVEGSEREATEAMESLLAYLLDNAAAFPVFANSPHYDSFGNLFINTGAELNQLMPESGGSNQLFVQLRPYLSEVERTDLLPLLGETFSASLKEKRKAQTLSEAEKKLMPYIGRALTYQAYANAIPFLQFRTSELGLRVVSFTDALSSERPAEPKLVQNILMRIQTSAESNLRALRKFLIDNADDYPQLPDQTIIRSLPDNTPYKGIFRMR